MNVVVANQSPALFNLLARSNCWSMRMAPLGDHEGLAEMVEMAVPVWNADSDPAPDVVIVCSPAQLETARTRWPQARIVWAIHNGYERWLLPREHQASVAGALCFSDKVRWLQQPGKSTKHYVISPAYEAEPLWQWSAGATLWTLRNRPHGRGDDADIVLAAVTDGLAHVVYGQGQERGVADAARKRELCQRSAAYVSPMLRTGGFGLAEHEAFAAGVPVIGGWWGDLETEMPAYYWGLQHSMYAMSRGAMRACLDREAAEELSQLGLDYIRQNRTMTRMDTSIRWLLSKIG